MDVKKFSEPFIEIGQDKYTFPKFYAASGRNLKLGIHEDAQHYSKLAEFLRLLTNWLMNTLPATLWLQYITSRSKTSKLSFLVPITASQSSNSKHLMERSSRVSRKREEDKRVRERRKRYNLSDD